MRIVERQIKLLIGEVFRVEGEKCADIRFSLIGKESKAHIEGYAAIKSKTKGIKINAAEVLRIYGEINKS